MRTSQNQPTQNSTQEWLSAFFTLLVLLGIYNSMDHFSGFAPEENESSESPTSLSQSVGKPYWNENLKYGFRPLFGDTLSSTGNSTKDVVFVQPTEGSRETVKVSYYKDGDIGKITENSDPGSPRVYSRLAGGIAVLEGDIESPTAKTIYSTLYSD